MTICISSTPFEPIYTDSFYTLNNVELLFNPSLSLITTPLTGTLSITPNLVSLYDKTTETLVSIDYPSILIHAISRGNNDTLTQKPCIYCQYKSVNDDEGECVYEFRLIPEVESELDPIFSAICDGSALHPDSVEDDDEAEYEQDEYMGQGWITSDVQMEQLSEQGKQTMERLESMLSRNSEDDVIDR